MLKPCRQKLVKTNIKHKGEPSKKLAFLEDSQLSPPTRPLGFTNISYF